MKQIFKIHLIIALQAFVVILLGCSKTDTGVVETTKNASTADTVKVYITDGGKLQAILNALRMEERNKATWAWNIDVDFFQDGDTIADGGMIADSGKIEQSKGMKRSHVNVFGHVHLIAPDGTQLFSDSLRWNPTKQQIESNSKVKIIKGNEIIEGIGFSSDANFQRIHVKKVHGKIDG